MTDDSNMAEDVPKTSRWKLIGAVLVLAAGSVGYRLITTHELKQTSALFIGLPAVLAILLALTRPAKSATGGVLKGLTVLLLLSGILLGEGFICIVMSAPLFYLVGFIVGQLIDRMQKREERRIPRIFGLVLLPFVPLSLEGVSSSLSFPRAEEVTVERVVWASTAAVERSLWSTPEFQETLPLFFRLGFPRPRASWGEGLDPGAYRAVRFSRADEPPGILVLRVSERSPESVRFEAESDTTMIAQWLTWRSVEVRWSALSPRSTRVRWTVHYERRLDPAWYFGPWERYAVRLAASYLIDATATPDGIRPR